MKRHDIQIRDPFIVPVDAAQRYYLFGTTDKNCWKGPGEGFDCYRSSDLETGILLMLWSSHGEHGYAMGIARSVGGTISGPWEQEPQPIWEKDSGHGMIFRAFDGRLLMTLHTPNETPFERPIFIEIEETAQSLRAK